LTFFNAKRHKCAIMVLARSSFANPLRALRALCGKRFAFQFSLFGNFGDFGNF